MGLEVGQPAERRRDGDEDEQVLLLLHRQAGLLDAGLQIDALASSSAFRAPARLSWICFFLTVRSTTVARARALVGVLAIAWRR